jgi:predicted amidohydrolase
MKLVLVEPALSVAHADENVARMSRLLSPLAGTLAPDDIVLLPEHYAATALRSEYDAAVGDLARTLGCTIVGGSHHEDRDGARVNTGAVVNGDGTVVGRYEKLRPYAEERRLVRDGRALGEFTIGGRHVLVLVCADFWFSDVFYRATALPDLVLVPSFSVSRKPTPDYSRALWRHLAVSRAYEFGAYVGISDWMHSSEWPTASGVSGFADPTAVDPEKLFLPTGGELRVYELDWDALEGFRGDRVSRGFFWKRPEAATGENP